jgi:hypothetical protein
MKNPSIVVNSSFSFGSVLSPSVSGPRDSEGGTEMVTLDSARTIEALKARIAQLEEEAKGRRRQKYERRMLQMEEILTHEEDIRHSWGGGSFQVG